MPPGPGPRAPNLQSHYRGGSWLRIQTTHHTLSKKKKMNPTPLICILSESPLPWWARSKIRPLLYKRFFVSEEMRKTSLPSRNRCISTLVSWLSTLPRHTGKYLTWILWLPRYPTWILHLPRRRRGSFIFLVTQEVNNVDNTYILVANVDSIVSSSHRNCTTWIF